MKNSLRLIGQFALVLALVAPAYSAEACGSNTADKSAACSDQTKSADAAPAADTTDSRARLELSNDVTAQNGANETRRHGRGLMARENIEQGATTGAENLDSRASLDITKADANTAANDARRHGRSLMARENIEREILNTNK